MNIYVCIKQVPDTTTRIKLNPQNDWIQTDDVQWIISPADELAIEEALRTRERESGSTVTVLSAGPPRVVDSIRMALAMGADAGVHVELPEEADSYLTAKALAASIDQLAPVSLVYTGKEAIDDGAAAVSPMLAEFLGIGCVTVVQEIKYEMGKLICRRDVGGGNAEWIEARLPVLVACQIGLNQPRYATALNIIKAKKKEVKTVSLAELGLSDTRSKTRLKAFELPPPKAPCRFIQGDSTQQARELVRVLREELKAI